MDKYTIKKLCTLISVQSFTYFLKEPFWADESVAFCGISLLEKQETGHAGTADQ